MTSVKKRILFIITQSEFGGAQRFLSTFAPKLSPDSYQLLVATGVEGDAHFSEHLKNLQIPMTTIAHLVRSPRPIHDFKALFQIRELIRSFKPDTVFLLSSKAGWIGSLATVFPSRLRGVRVIYRIGGWTFNDPWNILRKRFYRAMERLSARWKDIIIVNNRHDLLQAENLRIRPRQKTVLIHNGLDVYKMKFLEREKAREKFPAAEFIVGTIANFYPSKGLSYFIETARLLRNDSRVLFVIIGDGQLRPELERLIKQAGLEKKVVLAGRLREASRYLPAFDVFVSPSLKEGFQWAVAEAMTAKVPVIATTAGATPEIISDGVNGFLVELRNPAQVADRIQRLLGDDHLRQEFGIQGHQTILHKFDLEKMITSTEALL